VVLGYLAGYLRSYLPGQLQEFPAEQLAAVLQVSA
jgi:hypothetical protein